MADAIRIGDPVEVIEGSWAGRTGVVTALIDERYVEVTYNDDGRVAPTVACTLAKEVSE